MATDFALLLLSNVKLPRICYTKSEKCSYSCESNSNQLPSLFKNSCTGTDSVHDKEGLHFAADLHSEDDALSEGPSDLIKRKGGPGGYTCCVPECFSNSKRDPSLSFYSFPDGKSEDKVLLIKRWLHLVDRKDFRLTHGTKATSVGRRSCIQRINLSHAYFKGFNYMD